MENILFGVLVITSLCSLSAKHVFVTTSRTWQDAQEYCRSYFTDLSPITSELEDQVFRRSVSGDSSGWIGLYWDPLSPTRWMWSGGVSATYKNWSKNSYFDSNYNFYSAIWTNDGWYPVYNYHTRSFFCLNLIIVEVKKTWEEALEHCRETYTDLSSLPSETENLLALKKILQDQITDGVWIGLRYLGGRWLWVNDDPLVYEAWPQGDQDHQCSMWNRCGALTKGGLWENKDCQEKLNFICI